MHYMFAVRSSPCPAPDLQSRPLLHAACAAVVRRLPSPSPHLAPHRMPSFRQTDLETMLVELDINSDGGVDLWEFCVYLQKGRDARAEDESNWELDQAFQLFSPDEDDQGR